MRETLAGLALAVVFIAALFLWDRFSPPKTGPEAMVQYASEVQTGFVGTRAIGPWLLSCDQAPITVGGAKQAPVPLSLGGPAPPAGATRSLSLGRCRVTLNYRQKGHPKQIVLTVSFRLAGQAQRLLMIVRMLPIAKKDDTFALRLGDKGLKLTIAGCEKNACISVAPLAMDAQAALLGAPKAQLVLPPGQDGKRAALPFPIVGLGPALAAMRRAES